MDKRKKVFTKNNLTNNYEHAECRYMENEKSVDDSYQEEINKIIYNEYPNANWEVIAEVYKDKDEIFLLALKGTYILKHEAGVNTLEKLNEFAKQHKQKIDTALEKAKPIIHQKWYN